MRYAGTCCVCGAQLPEGTPALFHVPTRTVRCVACAGRTDGSFWKPVDVGVAGGSAEREYQRRAAERKSALIEGYGNRLGGFLARVTDEPQSTRAWEKGARGEQRLAEVLAGLPYVAVLNDRAVAGTRGNIDHIVIGPAGVFVVDSKSYMGAIQVRDVGGWFRNDERLYVGRRDCTHLAEKMGWQVEAVEGLLDYLDCGAPVTPVLCFVGTDWPVFAPTSFRGVQLEEPRSLARLVTATGVLFPNQIDWLARALGSGFPAK
jgi:hypothetical protein